MSLKVYLASPYSHPQRKIREMRYRQALTATGVLINAGFVAYSPIVHNHVLAECFNLPKGWDYWKEADSSFLSWCSVMLILTLDGWEKSNGIKGEKIIAMDLQKPFYHWDFGTPIPDDLIGGGT